VLIKCLYEMHGATIKCSAVPSRCSFSVKAPNDRPAPVCAPQISSCHAAQIISEFLAKHSISVSPHMPYSPDPAPCDFLLFPRLMITLKGKKLQYVTKMQRNITRQLKAIPQKAYNTCIGKWNNH